MTRYSFSYLTLRGKHYPLIPIKLHYGDNAVKTYALVDSGSTLSVFRAEIAALVVYADLTPALFSC